MPQPVIFISYSHEDEAEKDKLLSHLKVLQREGLISLWSADRIGTGADWKLEIKRAMVQAKVAILLISADFLTSDFILDQEVPTLLNRREREGLTVFPVIARACAWQQVSWIAGMSVRPKNGRPIWAASSRQVDEDLAAIAEEVAAIVKASPRTLSSSDVYQKAEGGIRQDEPVQPEALLPDQQKEDIARTPFSPNSDEKNSTASDHSGKNKEGDSPNKTRHKELSEPESLYQEMVSITLKIKSLLSNQAWAGLSGIATILALCVAILTFCWPVNSLLPTPNPTPTSISLSTPTLTAISTTPPTPTEAFVSPPPPPADTPIAPTGNLAIPLVFNFGTRVYLTGFDGAGINGPNEISIDAQQPIFSQDGKSVMVKAIIEGVSGIYFLSASGFGGTEPLRRGSAEWPVLSPDGKTVLFSESTLNYRLHKWVLDDGSIEEVFLRNDFSIFAKNLLWSEDNQLIFQGCATWLDEADTCGIWLTNVNHLDPQRLIENNDAYPMSARAGSLTYMSQKDGDWDIYLIPLAGGEATNLTNNDFEDGLPAISPDGDAIAYISNESGKWGLWTMSLGDQNKHHWFNIDPTKGVIDINQWNNERMSWRR